jgi:hypothetical protein
MDVTPVRELLQLDGGDVEVVSAGPDGVHFRLLLSSAECADCVMPKTVLEDVSSKLLGVTVLIDDPRET